MRCHRNLPAARGQQFRAELDTSYWGLSLVGIQRPQDADLASLRESHEFCSAQTEQAVRHTWAEAVLEKAFVSLLL